MGSRVPGVVGPGGAAGAVGEDAGRRLLIGSIIVHVIADLTDVDLAVPRILVRLAGLDVGIELLAGRLLIPDDDMGILRCAGRVLDIGLDLRRIEANTSQIHRLFLLHERGVRGLSGIDPGLI